MSGLVDEVFYGSARLLFIDGKVLENLHEGVYVGANAQGVMGAGLPAEIRRAGGQEVERELRTQGPLMVGAAYLTTAGDLEERGVRSIAHGVVTREPGASATLATSASALLDALRQLEEAGCRSVTVPQLGWRVVDLDPRTAALELGRVIMTHLRRRSRLGLVAVVSSDRDYLRAMADACRLEASLAQEDRTNVGC